MRTIKFRAWDKEEKRMCEWNDHFFSDMSPVTNYDDTFPKKDRNIILMQFTGLYDTAGKEIYEGDIVQNLQSKEFKGVIEYIQNDASFGVSGVPFIELSTNRGYSENYEVIGNVYQNKDLLID